MGCTKLQRSGETASAWWKGWKVKYQKHVKRLTNVYGAGWGGMYDGMIYSSPAARRRRGVRGPLLDPFGKAIAEQPRTI